MVVPLNNLVPVVLYLARVVTIPGSVEIRIQLFEMQ